MVDLRREQVANKPGNYLYARKPRRNEKDVNCNDCGRTRLSLYCKGSRYWATWYLITLYSHLIISDNAKTFKAADKALKKLFNHPEVANELSSKMIEWKFNLKRAPWWGGFFERMVGCVKRCLRKVLGNARLTSDELFTVLIEVKGTLNSHPLTYEYDESGEKVLTPWHLIFGRRIKTVLDEIVEDKEGESRYTRRFKYLSVRLAHFWNRWRHKYLTDLREFHRTKVSKDPRPVQIGDVVTVYDESKRRGEWRFAVIESLIKGNDNVVRGQTFESFPRENPRACPDPFRSSSP